jgi:uncharacterized membrane protein (UPF0136 family)
MELLATIVIWVYALLLIGGGVAGWKLSGSRISLTAGLGSAFLLIVAYRISLSAPSTGYLVATLSSLSLLILFSSRYRKSGKFMPSGMMLIVSGLATALLAFVTVVLW